MRFNTVICDNNSPYNSNLSHDTRLIRKAIISLQMASKMLIYAYIFIFSNEIMNALYGIIIRFMQMESRENCRSQNATSIRPSGICNLLYKNQSPITSPNTNNKNANKMWTSTQEEKIFEKPSLFFNPNSYDKKRCVADAIPAVITEDIATTPAITLYSP